MYKNYIFDFGQVIVKFDPYYMTSRYIENEEDKKLASDIIFDRLYWDKLDAGTITDEEVKKEIQKRLPERLHKNALLAYDNWYMNIPLIEGMENIITTLKNKGKKLYLLSNISIGFADNYCKNTDVERVLSLFDGLVFSGKIGLVKPNADIFNYLLNKFDLKPEKTIFIDDNIRNIDGAKSLGINGYLFDGDVEKIKSII